MNAKAAVTVLAVLASVSAGRGLAESCSVTGVVALALPAPRVLKEDEAISLQITVAPKPGTAVQITDETGTSVGSIVSYGSSSPRTYNFVMPRISAGQTVHLRAKVEPLGPNGNVNTGLCIWNARLQVISVSD